MPIPNTPIHRPLARSSANLVMGVLVIGLLVSAPLRSAHASSGRGEPGSSGDATLSRCSASTSTVPTATTPGIDVSHWQGVIDWAKVAGAGKEFVFQKATEGTKYLDPTFTSNRSHARANGMSVGAYHFAKPDRSSGDAAREARWFVSQAQPKAGQLLPVLDIERSGGLTQDQMTRWARRWVAEVRDLTGVTPLIYTSPCGWSDRFGNTKRLARDGVPLWVAHWGVKSPLVPADDWDGHGWMLWQRSSTGRVAGIGGDVDLDVLAGTSLGRITVRRLSLSVEGDAGVVTSTPAGLGCRTECEHNVNPDETFTLTAKPDDGASFTGWGGDCSGTGTTCTITMNGNRDVTASFLTDITAPSASLDAPSGFTDPATVTFDETVRGVTRSNLLLHEGDDGTRVPVSRRCLSGVGGKVPCATGKVRSIELSPQGSLVPGRDYVVAVNPAGTPAVKDLVGNHAAPTELPFRASTAVESNRAPIGYAWRRLANAGVYGGSYLVERQPGAALSFEFKGSSITWYAVAGPAYGKAEVLVDGRSERIVDLYAPTWRTRVARHVDGLGRGAHTITIRALGRARPAARDHLVAVDAFGTLSRGIVRTPRTKETWRTMAAAPASGGSIAVADLPGASATLRFDGVGVDWTTVTASDAGKAKLFVDGAPRGIVDLYSSVRTFEVVEHIAGLAQGAHTLRIEVAGTANAASTGSVVSIDRFDVQPGP